MLVDARSIAVLPVAGIPIIHELSDAIELDLSLVIDWPGSEPEGAPVVIRHELGDARPTGMRAVLDVPPWCTFYLDADGEPATVFHGVFDDVPRLLRSEQPGGSYVVHYGSPPQEPVIPLQSELVAFSFALSARESGLIAHSCAFVTPAGTGVLCPGVSGTGKTTLARLLVDHAPNVQVLTDDRAVLTLDHRGLRVWGSPWPGAARIAVPASAPLSAVVFIRHGATCTAREVSPRDAFRRIVNTLSMPLWDPARCGPALQLIDAIVSRTRLIEVAYPLSAHSVDWLLNLVEQSEPLGTNHGP